MSSDLSAAAEAPAGFRLSPVLALRTLTILGVLAAWEILARSGLLYEGVVPSVLAIVPAMGGLLATGEFYHGLAITGFEVLCGFAIGALIGVSLGILLGVQPYLRRAAQPYINALATAPKIIFLPIVMLFFGIGPMSKMAIGALAAFFPVVLSTTAGVMHIEPVYFRVARSLNFNARQTVSKVCIPAVAGPIVTGMRLGLAVTIVAVLLGEIKLAKAGLGFMAIEFYNQYRIPQLYALLIVIFALAALLNAGMSRVESRFRAPGTGSEA